MDDRDRIVIDSYPVANLPEDLRRGHDLGAAVRVILEPIEADEDVPLTRILDEMQDQRVASDDPVERIRALRAEWDDRDEIMERIRRGHDQ
ncbi:hypothetical protein ACFQU1_10795 [Chelatococcus sp. GCM10030263]|uniref:hypothetical protein n=1 Tax=Chelatococcus sp. GCM10030263 TaxID=3273387 RepID=UPI003615980B